MDDALDYLRSVGAVAELAELVALAEDALAVQEAERLLLYHNRLWPWRSWVRDVVHRRLANLHFWRSRV
jgi:hypothetical protein